jgi:hypothetical protein
MLHTGKSPPSRRPGRKVVLCNRRAAGKPVSFGSLRAAVAQWIEYWPPKPRVAGSIPASRTISFLLLVKQPTFAALIPSMPMRSRKDRRTVVIAVAVAMIGVISLTWHISPGPKQLWDLLLILLFCPNFNVFGGSCSSSNPFDYVLPWGALLIVTAAFFFGTRWWIRSGHGDDEEHRL